MEAVAVGTAIDAGPPPLALVGRRCRCGSTTAMMVASFDIIAGRLLEQTVTLTMKTMTMIGKCPRCEIFGANAAADGRLLIVVTQC